MATHYAGFRHLLYEVDGLAVHAVGSLGPLPARAPVVVLVHGLALSHRYMMPLARELAALGCRVYVPDLPGFGNSGHPPAALDVAELAGALRGWMTAAGLERASLVGNSFGCQVIAELAARRPERIERIVLQGPTAPPRERNTLRQFIRWRQNDRYNPPELRPISSEDYRRSGYGRAWATFRHSLRDHIEDKVADIRAPALVVRGECDPICPVGWTMALAQRLPNGRVVEIPGVAHTLCYTAPVELARVSRLFLDEHDSVRSAPER